MNKNGARNCKKNKILIGRERLPSQKRINLAGGEEAFWRASKCVGKKKKHGHYSTGRQGSKEKRLI